MADKEHNIRALLQVAAAAGSGNYVKTGLAVLKNWKAIIGIVLASLSALILLCAVVTSLPGILMQAAMPESKNDTYNELKIFAENEIKIADSEKENAITDFLKSLISDSEDEVGSVIGDIPDEELYILYCCKYGEYTDKMELDKAKIRSLTLAFFTIDGINLVVKPFEEVVENIGLTEEQKIIALNMYNSYMFTQGVSGIGADAPGVKDFGNYKFTGGQIEEVVYYNQRDVRWSSSAYGDGTIGGAGCGPSSLAIVASTFGKNVTPADTCKWAAKNGYKAKGGGSYWSVIPDGAKHYGLKVESNVKESDEIRNALKNGKLVVVIMGAGHFTKSGHFIVLRGITDSGKILVADPASEKRSNEEWDLSLIMNEAKNGRSAGGPYWIISE